MNKIKLRWVISHEPVELFLRTADAFVKEINEKAGDRLEVEIIIEPETPKLLNRLTAGEMEITHTESYFFGQWNKNFRVFDMPFLFRDHDHCTRVLEGQIGTALCQNLANHANMRGLGFTYSGGYRVIGSQEPIETFEDLQNLRIVVNHNPVNSYTMNAVGAIPQLQLYAVDNYGYDRIANNEADASETTYIRFQRLSKGKAVLKTNHSMFITVIAINETFFQGLDKDLKEIIETAAKNAAVMERKISIKDAEEFEKNCHANGVTITELSAEDQKQFYDSVMPIYDEWKDQFLPGMIEHIKLH